MTLPKNTPPEILALLTDYRNGIVNQEAVRQQIAELVKSKSEIAEFHHTHLKWLEHDDAVEWW